MNLVFKIISHTVWFLHLNWYKWFHRSLKTHTEISRYPAAILTCFSDRTYSSQFNTVSLGLLWLLGLFEGSDPCPQTNTLWEHVCTHVGWVACWAALLPGVSAHERGLLYSENILRPSHPPVVSAPMERRSWESPRYKRGQFVVRS